VRSSYNGPVFEVIATRDFSIKGIKLKSSDPADPAKPIAFYFGSPGSGKHRTMGIRVTDSSNINITNNTIVGYWSGIHITAKRGTCSDIVIRKNTVTDCGYWSVAAHSNVKELAPGGDLRKIRIEGNYITRCEQGPFSGVSAIAL
jgi:parallel beta-helix repeat protein